MSVYTRLASGLLFPLHEAVKGHSSVALRRELEATQWLAPEDLDRLRQAALGRFLRHAVEHVPYYREALAGQARVTGEPVTTDQLRQLPLLDKPTIRANAGRLKADDAGPMKLYNTGGSSGEPLRFWIDRQRVSHDVAAKWRATRWWNVDIGDRELVVWGSPIEIGAQDRLRTLRDRLLRTRLLSAFDLGDDSLDRHVDAIIRFRPRMLFGYPSALARIAAHAAARGRRMDDLGIAVAFVTSEQVFADQRRTIGEVFGCPVANGYGGRDFGFVAHQCPSGSLHICAEDIIVEIIGPASQPLGPGAAGEIVITHLRTPGFPFIRYRTGDVGVLDDRPCACGRGLPVLREVQGRTTDFLTAANGASVHALALIYVLRDLEGLRQFRIVQESRDLVRVELVRDAGFDAAVLPQIVQQFRRRLGESMRVEIGFADAIAAAGSGKHRYVVNKTLAAAPPAS